MKYWDEVRPSTKYVDNLLSEARLTNMSVDVMSQVLSLLIHGSIPFTGQRDGIMHLWRSG